MDQPVRKVVDPETYGKIEELVKKLTDVLEDDDGDEQETASPRWAKGEKPIPPFTIKLDDPAGNSFIQFLGNMNDPKWSMRAYPRTRDQNAALGLVAEDDGAKAAEARGSAAAASEARIAAQSSSAAAGGSRPDKDHVVTGPLNPLDTSIIPEEVFNFPGACSSCGHEIMTLMQRVNIPHFKVRAEEMVVGDGPPCVSNRPFYSIVSPCLSYVEPGHHHHVNQLRPLWLSRQ